MMKRLIFVLLSAALLFGCGTRYLEVETPAGVVPTVMQVPHDTVDQGLQNAYNAEVAEAPAPRGAEQMAAFEAAYQDMQRPRIAVLFNRSLNDRITEWESNRRLAFSQDVDIKTAAVEGGAQPSRAFLPVGDFSQGEVKQASAALDRSEWVAVQHKVKDADPRELSWNFQEGFIEPWLDAGVNLIDRATIMRLTAADQGNAEGLNIKSVETNALRGYADIFVEVLVDDTYEREGFYRFRASVKDIATGSLLASTVMEYPGDAPQSVKYEATARGFQSVTDAFDAGKILAVDVMGEMSRRM